MCSKNRHMNLVVLFLVIFSANYSAEAAEANFLNSQILRMKDKYDSLEIINPLLTFAEKKEWGGNLDLIGEKDVYRFYQDISSKNQSQINQRLQQSFGSPYSFFGKIDLYSKFNFESSFFLQTLHADMGGSFYLTDPVFPEVNTLLFQNYGASSALNLFSPNDYKINLSLNYGATRLLQKTLNVGDLVESRPSFKLKEIPYKFYLSLDIHGEYNLFNLGNIIIKINSIPIVKEDYELFNSFVGAITNDILPSSFEIVEHIKFYGGYSPFYRGDYSVKRTVVVGSTLGLTTWMNFDVFTTDQMYVGGLVKIGTEFLNASLYTYQDSYDDYGINKFRNYGFNLNFNF